MIRFSCTVCREFMECPESQAGTKASCPKCGRVARIPLPVAALATAVPEATRAAPDSADYVTRCRLCGKVIRISDAYRMPESVGQFHFLSDWCADCWWLWWKCAAIVVAIVAVLAPIFCAIFWYMSKR